MNDPEVEAVENQILNLLGNAIDDYKESLKSVSTEEVTAYACRSIAASAIIVATIKTLSREYL